MPENDPKSDDALSGLLGALLGGQSGGQNQAQTGGQGLEQLLGDLMGGVNAAPGASSSDNPLGGLLGSLMGGESQTGSANAGGDPLGAALSGLFTGQTQENAPSAGGLAGNAFLAPIIEAIAAKIGIPPQIAGAVVSFALTQLLSGQRDPQLAQMLAGKGTVSPKYLRDSGLANQLAQQTGMDSKTAVKSLQQVFQVFGTQMGQGTTEDRAANLQDWLGT